MLPDSPSLFAVNRPEDLMWRLPSTLLSPVTSVGKVVVGQILPSTSGLVAQVLQDTIFTVGGVVAGSASNCASLLSLPASAVKLSHTMLCSAVGRIAPDIEPNRVRKFNVQSGEKRTIRRNKLHSKPVKQALPCVKCNNFELVVDMSVPLRVFTPSTQLQVSDRWVTAMALQSSML